MLWMKKKKLPEFGTVSCATCKWCGEDRQELAKALDEVERNFVRWCDNPETVKYEEAFSPFTGQLVRIPFKLSIRKINSDGNCSHWEAKDA